jgi:hypothetical protein
MKASSVIEDARRNGDILGRDAVKFGAWCHGSMPLGIPIGASQMGLGGTNGCIREKRAKENF